MPGTLVTGGAGYIGSHVATALASSGRRFVLLDNFVNTTPQAVDRLRELVPGGFEVVEADIRDGERVRETVLRHGLDSLIHMAGLKAVGESVSQPLRYYDNNVSGTLMMLRALEDTPLRRFVFSSSATVYGAAERMPIAEDTPTGPTNPYGMTKLMVEHILRDMVAADPSWRVANLRYFNPVGAHESGRIGETPNGIPNNLMPYVCQVAAKQREELRVFGSDYPTVDGTGVRDYIHVMDLAEGHVAALRWLETDHGGERFATANLGTGQGYSVLQLVDAFEKANGIRIPHRIVERRPGDIATCYADPSRARQLFGWKARRGIEDMVRDAWRYQSQGL